MTACMARFLTVMLLTWPALVGVAWGQEMKIRPQPAAREPVSNGGEDGTSPRDLLDLLGARDWLDRATDGADFPPMGDEMLWRSLHAVRRLPLADIDRWQRPFTRREISAGPGKFRGEVFAFTGTILGFSRHEPPADAAERFNLLAYYRCELEIGDTHDRAIVYALGVPRAWKANAPISERVGVKGMFVMLGNGDGAAPPVLVARRIAWYPRTPLGDLEMDVGLFDEISPRPVLAVDDRECFYQLLAAVGRVGTRQLLRAVPQEGRGKDGRGASVEPLFNRPQTQQGKLVELTGTARQAVLRRVEDRDIIDRFGINHYYEMQVFTGDSQDNPLTFCVRELPSGFPQGERITESVRIAGFFFKKWGYRSAAGTPAAQPGRIQKQLAPLLIGREPVWIRPEPADQRFANGVFLVLFVMLTVVLWFVVSRLSRSDDKFHQQVSQRLAPPSTVALSDPANFAPADDDQPQTTDAANDEVRNEAPPPDPDEEEAAAALREITAREIGNESVADQYRTWKQRRELTGLQLAGLVGAVVAGRLLVWALRHAGL